MSFQASEKDRLSEAESSLLRTVAYSSIFDYPLTAEEVSRGLVQGRLDPEEVVAVFRSSRCLPRAISHERGFFFLRGKEGSIDRRRHREVITQRLLGRNRRILQLISALPGIRLVALSGSAAFNNVDRRGDIDLFVVTRARRVWTAALLILLVTKLSGRRELVCTNFLVSERHLEIKKPDLFSANQLINLRPLTGRGHYRELLDANPFVLDYHPNASAFEASTQFRCPALLKGIKKLIELLLWPGPGWLLETVSREVYRRYLVSRSGDWLSPQEVVLEDEVLKLHTKSHRQRVLREYERRLEKLSEKMKS